MAESTPTSRTAVPSRLRWWAVALLAALVALPCVLLYTIATPIFIDENQHIAAANLILREGLLPYRDFACFHTPFYPYVLAVVFSFSDYLLLSGRLLTTASYLVVVGLTVAESYRLAWRARAARPLWWAVGVLLLLLLTPAFGRFGFVWNHELPLAFGLAALICLGRAAELRLPGWSGLGGLLLGIAIGMRITYAPLVAAGAIFLLADPDARRQWLPMLVRFALGLLGPFMVLLWFWSQDPVGMEFGVFGISGANAEYRHAINAGHLMTWERRLRFFLGHPFRIQLPIYLLSLGACYLWLREQKGKSWSAAPWEFRAAVVFLPFVAMGAFAPAPTYYQYFLPLAPVLLLGGVAVGTRLRLEAPRARQLVRIAALLILPFTLLSFFRAYQNIAFVAKPKQWPPVVYHRAAKYMRYLVGSREGPLLTFDPAGAYEGKMTSYPGLATGVFGFRLHPYLPERIRQRPGYIMGAASLREITRSLPPCAVVTSNGYRRRTQPLIEWAYPRSERIVDLGWGDAMWLMKPRAELRALEMALPPASPQ